MLCRECVQHDPASVLSKNGTMPNLLPTTQSKKNRLLKFVIGTTVGALHVVLMWHLSQSTTTREYKSRPRMALVLIKELTLKLPHPPSMIPIEKPMLQESRIPMKHVHGTSSIADSGGEQAASNSSTVAEPTGTIQNSSEQTQAVSTAQGQRNTAGGLQLFPTEHFDLGPRQKSYAEQANEQLHPGAPRNALAENIKSAGIPDCMKDAAPGGLLGLPFLIYNATTGKCK